MKDFSGEAALAAEVLPPRRRSCPLLPAAAIAWMRTSRGPRASENWACIIAVLSLRANFGTTLNIQRGVVLGVNFYNTGGPGSSDSRRSTEGQQADGCCIGWLQGAGSCCCLQSRGLPTAVTRSCRRRVRPASAACHGCQGAWGGCSGSGEHRAPRSGGPRRRWPHWTRSKVSHSRTTS